MDDDGNCCFHWSSNQDIDMFYSGRNACVVDQKVCERILRYCVLIKPHPYTFGEIQLIRRKVKSLYRSFTP